MRRDLDTTSATVNGSLLSLSMYTDPDFEIHTSMSRSRSQVENVSLLVFPSK